MRSTFSPRRFGIAGLAFLTLGQAVSLAQSATSTQPTTEPATQVSGTRFYRDLCYRPDGDDALRRACTLDVYTPADAPATATVVWFHGGGMTAGDKAEAKTIAGVLTRAGIAVVAVNYRLSPAAKYPAYVEDAAAAVAWTAKRGGDFGANADAVFVGGYSAGGYLAFALGCDPRWLKASGFMGQSDAKSPLRGIVAISPQVFTHYAVRRERGVVDPEKTPVIDEAAPAFYAAADLPPIKLFCGDGDTPTRLEELQYFMAVLKAKKHPDASLSVIAGRNHGTMYQHVIRPGDPVATGIVAFVTAHAAARPDAR